jgi:Family of unknown function (DUF6011)
MGAQLTNPKEYVADMVQLLTLNMHRLSPKDQKFAQSLLDALKKYHGLTPSQEHWLGVMAQKACSAHPEIEKNVEHVSSFAGVYALFTKAKEKLKWPKINLMIDAGPLLLALAGAKSKVPNVINVTDGAPFGSNKWYGRVYPDGKWEQGNQSYPEMGQVRKMLEELAAEPAKVAVMYGKLTGRCCFCNRALSDEKSTAVGYGPICAEHFGLSKEWKEADGLLSQQEKLEGVIAELKAPSKSPEGPRPGSLF